MLLSDREFERVQQRCQDLSAFHPAERFRHGVSLENLCRYDVLADTESLSGLGADEARAILRDTWDRWGLDAFHPDIAADAFVMAAVFGEEITAALIDIAAKDAVSKSYPMSLHYCGRFSSALARDVAGSKRDTLRQFRLLQAGYVGMFQRGESW